MRFGDTIAQWVKKQADAAASDISFEIVDLKEVDLPFHDEMKPPASGEYNNKHTKDWAKVVDSADGFIFVSPEYNGGYTAVLKNALDSVYAEWGGKPVAIVGYGAGPGLKGAAQLRAVLEHMKMHPIEAQVNIASPWEAFTQDGTVHESNIKGDVASLVSGMITSVEA